MTAGRRLRTAGHRYTAGRRALVDVLATAEQPLAIHEIVRENRRLPQSSVYRNLSLLQQSRVVRRVVTHDEFSRYELAEDLSHHHHHLVCSSCGSVEDFTTSPQVERTMRKAMAQVAGETGFSPAGHRLDLVGLCRACA
jgi:Fur family transcriptional regulator, ferric uptake regulator